MLLRTILFAIFFYLLIRVIRNFFISTSQKEKSSARVFYEAFKNAQSNGKQQQNSRSSKSANNFDEIEEAEFEDITEEDKSTSKSSD